MNSRSDDQNEWLDLVSLTKGESFLIERVCLERTGVAVEGRFAPPPLAVLPPDDQVFVAAFVRSHGSIKEMERLFNQSYPTVKNRLNRIGAALGFMDVTPAAAREEVLERLSRGEITVDEALAALQPR